jgi:hypothetical protein
MEPRIYNLDKPSHRTALINHVLTLEGQYRVYFKKVYRGKSPKQLGYLFGVVYPTIADAATEAWGETVTTDDIHLEMKKRFLSKPIVNHETGEVMMTSVGSLAKLDVRECSEYIDKCVKLCGEYFHTAVEAADWQYDKLPKTKSPPIAPTDDEVF